jgi:RecA-superfamily ATPases implicated in signal transduction
MISEAKDSSGRRVRAADSRASTGVDGLDEILGGGLTRNRVYLLEGTPGTGKTTFALRFLMAGAARGERGLYVTLSETAEELKAVVDSHGWSLDGIDVFELADENARDPQAEQSVLYPSEVELGETIRALTARIERGVPARVVFDSLSEMRLLAQDPLRYRRQVLALKQFFATRSCTVLLIDDKTSEPGDLQLHSISHGVISLEQAIQEFGTERAACASSRCAARSSRAACTISTSTQAGSPSIPAWPRPSTAPTSSTSRSAPARPSSTRCSAAACRAARARS